MKYLFVSFFFLIILSCKSNQVEKKNNLNKLLTTECPQDGTCTLELLHDKSLKILKTNLSEIYTEIVEGESLVFKFEYRRNEIPSSVDGHYVEQVLIELDKNNLEIEFADSELKKAKVTFARFCYCKGQTGYYKVSQGNLSIKKIQDKTYQLILNFKVIEVPQIIAQVQEVFSLK